jgi:hypothetical protein
MAPRRLETAFFEEALDVKYKDLQGSYTDLSTYCEHARTAIMTLPTVYTDIQRVLHDLWRTRLSCCPLIWLQTPPPLTVSKLSLFLSLLMCRRSSLLTGEVEGVQGREETKS